MTDFTAPHSLQQLEQHLQRDLEYLGLPETPWLSKKTCQSQPIYDVIIIGGGMAGLTLAAALRFSGVQNIRLFDKNPPQKAGPWNTHARMQTLRSPKELTGPALGVPSLTFRAWYTAQYGEAVWDNLDRIPTAQWHHYLMWYQSVLQLPVSHQHELVELEQANLAPSESTLVKLQIQSPAGTQPYYARHVVLATGMDGLGGPNLPSYHAHLPKQYWAHSSESIDFSQHTSHHIAIVGGGDSALDAAATALDAGVKQVTIYMRQPAFSQINYWKALTHSGHRYGYAQLQTPQKVDLWRFLFAQSTPPARGTIQRLLAHHALQLSPDTTIQHAQVVDNTLCLRDTNGQNHEADFLIFATGYQTDLARRPELKRLVADIQRMQHSELGAELGQNELPVLNPDFSFAQAPNQTANPLLERVHCFTQQALLSVGKICGDIPSISTGANQLCQAIVAKLYRDDFDYQLEQLKHYDELEVSAEALDALYRNTRVHEDMDHY